MNQKFQNALVKTVQNCPPIWFMRQAGRYHKHYQALRKQHSFMDLCKNPELAAEVAMGPIEDFDFDISILFSDLLFPLESMGMGLKYDPGPILGWHLESLEDVERLDVSEKALSQLLFQKEACLRTRERLPDNKSFIGFVGGPWTLFSYAVAGSHENKKKVKEKLHLFEPFCEKLVPLLIKNIQLQLDGGVEVVMVLDTSAGELDPLHFMNRVMPQNSKLFDAYKGKLGYYTKNTNISHMKSIFRDKNIAGVGVDHRWDMADFLPKAPGFVQGNFDQQLLFQSTDEFKRSLDQFLEPMLNLTLDQRRGWVCGLGHGILPQTPEEHVRYFVKTVRERFSE